MEHHTMAIFWYIRTRVRRWCSSAQLFVHINFTPSTYGSRMPETYRCSHTFSSLIVLTGVNVTAGRIDDNVSYALICTKHTGTHKPSGTVKQVRCIHAHRLAYHTSVNTLSALSPVCTLSTYVVDPLVTTIAVLPKFEFYTHMNKVSATDTTCGDMTFHRISNS